jgi:hypothetical protein
MKSSVVDREEIASTLRPKLASERELEKIKKRGEGQWQGDQRWSEHARWRRGRSDGCRGNLRAADLQRL